MPPVYTRNGRIILRNGLPVVGDCCCTEEDRRKRCVYAEIEVAVAYSSASMSGCLDTAIPQSQSAAAAYVRSRYDSSLSFDPLPAGVADTDLSGRADPCEAPVATSARCATGDERLSISFGSGLVTYRAVVRNLGRLRISFRCGLAVAYVRSGRTPSGGVADEQHQYVADGVAPSLSVPSASGCVVRQSPAWPASWDPRFNGSCGAPAYLENDGVLVLELEVARP